MGRTQGAINTHDAGAALNIMNVKKFSGLHPRCGTSFLFIVVPVSILLFSIMPNLGFSIRLVHRVLLILLIVAIPYELLKLSDRYKDSVTMRILTMPSLAFQRLTTKESDDDILEVAANTAEEVRNLSSQNTRLLLRTA